MGPDREAVTLGEDSFRDYAPSADDDIIMGCLPVDSPRTSQGPGPPQPIVEQQHAGFNGPFEDVVGASSGWVDILPVSPFDREAADDPSDPHYLKFPRFRGTFRRPPRLGQLFPAGAGARWVNTPVR